MSLTRKIRGLCTEKNITIAELEREIGLSNGQIRRWGSVSPKAENLQKVADYFQVTTDYLLDRSNQKYWELTAKDEKSIQKRLEELMSDISTADGLAFSKESGALSEDTRELLLLSMETALRIAKQAAKEKFTPKKNRK
ncbi:MAG: helix-turn-helix domain-containing protein [Turicibacter sp.]|nr:helix-turn-helix domain-containing protein [Turicibacter sp.]